MPSKLNSSALAQHFPPSGTRTNAVKGVHLNIFSSKETCTFYHIIFSEKQELCSHTIRVAIFSSYFMEDYGGFFYYM